MPAEFRQERRGQDVVLWRSDQLVRAGFPVARAVQLGDDTRYDLHTLIDLTEQDCPPELAVNIPA